MSGILEAIKAVLFGRDKYRYEQDEQITMETVEAVMDNGRAMVRGALIPITGLATVVTGERVAVAWKKGMPVAIIKHRARRAQTHGKFYEGGSIVEQLFIGNQDKLGKDVWYRNGEKLVKVLVTSTDDYTGKLTTVSVRNHWSLQGQEPEEVKWGLDGRSFGVRCAGGRYVVFTFDRPDQNKYDEAFPGAAGPYYYGRPLDSMLNLTTVTYKKSVVKTFYWWVAKCVITWGYKAVRSAWYDGSMWYWYGYLAKLDQAWETTVQGQGSASASTSKSFPLKTMLTTGVADYYAGRNDVSVARDSVEDWYVDEERHLKFIIRAEWDYFWVGSTQPGSGTLSYPFGSGAGYKSGWTETISVGGGGMGCLGAKKQSDQTTVPEVHFFLFDGTINAITWASCDAAPEIGATTYQFTYGMWEHIFETDPGYSSDGLPEPHMGGWDQDGYNNEGYYLGANWSNLPVTWHHKTEGEVGREGTTVTSSTGTYQLFSRSTLPCMTGPFVYENTGGYSWGANILGLWTAGYTVSFKVRTQGAQMLYFYTMQRMQVFSRATAVGAGGGIYGRGLDEALFFVVVERYPFISGTGYINDLPMIWIGIIDSNGKAVLTLRDWQYGLVGAELMTGNGHEVVWVLYSPALNPKPKYFVTNVDSRQEKEFTNQFEHAVLTGESYDQMQPNDIAFFMESRAALFTPNFLWSYRAPERFYDPNRLPVTKEDRDLEPYAHLAGGETIGSTRMINDAELLDPLGKYQAA